jgi:hypothetical protein
MTELRGYGGETREEQLRRWEREGMLDPECAFCQREVYAATDKMPEDVFAPRHKALETCRSGRRPHCTCDTCF